MVQRACSAGVVPSLASHDGTRSVTLTCCDIDPRRSMHLVCRSYWSIARRTGLSQGGRDPMLVPDLVVLDLPGLKKDVLNQAVQSSHLGSGLKLGQLLEDVTSARFSFVAGSGMGRGGGGGMGRGGSRGVIRMMRAGRAGGRAGDRRLGPSIADDRRALNLLACLLLQAIYGQLHMRGITPLRAYELVQQRAQESQAWLREWEEEQEVQTPAI